ncbi:hypothetical protein [Kitasatospora sp. NPDC056531]|uniref:hypothetical protein n=1 Tax=Kitasatospora sp. NPDC056531 TaxID=3345856 RepID=UPI0036C80528
MVFDDLQAVLAAVRVKLPSMRVDWASVRTTGVVVIELGGAAPREIAKLVEVLREGARVVSASDGWVPGVGETVAIVPPDWEISTPWAPRIPAEVVEVIDNLVTLTVDGNLRLRRLHQVEPWTA